MENQKIKNRKKLSKAYQDSIINEDEGIIQHTLKGEARFLKGLIKTEYESSFKFLLAYFEGVLYVFIGLLGLIALLDLLFDFIKKKELSFIPIIIFPLFIALLSGIAGIKVIIKLFKVYKGKNKKFKLKTLWFIIMLTLIFAFILIKAISIIHSVIHSV